MRAPSADNQRNQILDPSMPKSDDYVPNQAQNDNNGQLYYEDSPEYQIRKRQSLDFDQKQFQQEENISLIKIEEHTLSHQDYSISTLINCILSIATLAIIKQLFTQSNITSYEIVYAKCVIASISLLTYLVVNGVYILGLDVEQRTRVMIRGFLVFGGLTLFYSSLHHLTNLSSALIVQFSCLCITQFFFLKHERQQFLNVIGMSLSLISLTMIFIQVIEPIVADSNVMNLDKMIGFAQAGGSGVILAIISYLNYQTSQIRDERLQSFYANCICACFSPFLILKDISDRKKITKYGFEELYLLIAISVITILQSCWFEKSIIKRFIEGEGRKMINLGFVQILIALAIDYFYFGFNEQDSDNVRIIVGCGVCSSISVFLMTWFKDFSLNF